MKYSGNHPRFSAQDYDAKEAYNKDLTASARLHYLENDEHDKGSPAHKMDPMYNGKPGVQKDDFAQFSGSKAPTNYGTEHSSPVAMTDAASYRSKMAKHWSASNSRFDMPIMHDEAGRKGEGSPNMMLSPLNKEPRRVKQETEGRDNQGASIYIRGGRDKKENARSVEVSKDYGGDETKTVRRRKNDGSIKTTSKKISDKAAARIKKRKDKSHDTEGSPNKMVSPLRDSDEKKLERKQKKQSRTIKQIDKTYDKDTPNSKKEDRKIKKYEKTKAQVKDLGEKTGTYIP